MAKKIWLLLMMVLVLTAALPVFAAESTLRRKQQIETITLDKCLDLALQNSKQLQQTAESVRIAQAGVQEASSGFWPTVGYKYSYVDEVIAPSMSIPGLTQQQAQTLQPLFPLFSDMEDMMEGLGYSGYLSVTQPLYTGGKLTNTLKLAQLNLNSALEDQRKAKQQLCYNVKEAYYSFWLTEKMLEVAQDSENNFGLHYQRVTNLYKAGTASAFDLLYAKVQWENQKPQVIKAKNGLALARLNLATIIGLEQNLNFQVEYDPSNLKFPETIDIIQPAILDEAYQRRPEMHQINQLKEIDQVNVELAKAGYKPTISLSCDYSVIAGSQITLGDGYKVLTLGADISGLIFDGFATKARISKAKENINLTQTKEDSLKDQIRLETEQALQNLEDSLETTRANQANIELAQESLKQTQIRFMAGVATTTDITDSQLALEQTLNGYYQGISSYLTGLAKLDLIAGRDMN